MICVSSATQHNSIIDQPHYKEDSNTNTCNTQIIRKNTDGSITLYEQTYPISSSNQYGYKVSRSLNKIQQQAPLLSRLSDIKQQHLIMSFVYDIVEKLIEELLSLALLHKEQWEIIVSADSMTINERNALDHFSKATNAWKVITIIYQCLWHTVQEYDHVFSKFDQEAIVSGESSVLLLLADMHHQSFLQKGNNGQASIAYKYLVQAEKKTELSLTLLADVIDSKYDLGMDVQLQVRQVTESMAFASVRIGALLSDMYVAGYIMDEDDNLHFNPHTVKEQIDGASTGKSTLNDGQIRILNWAKSKLFKGHALYKNIEKKRLAAEYNSEYTDSQMNIADASNYIGVLFGYLLQWELAIKPLHDSLEIYETFLDEYQSNQAVDEAVEVATSMVSTTQSLWETFLNMPGLTDAAKHAFRKHLVLRRYVESQIPMHRPLIDEEYEDSNNRNNLLYSIEGENEELYDETLKEYQTLLDDYLKLISELPPDGSYYDMGFDAYGDSASSTVQHDKVYEGSIRAAIGPIYLAKGQAKKAKLELELAVSLLREGSLNGEAREYEDGNGELIDYSVELELANALLSLAYVNLGVSQFKSSFDTFEEAMDIFQSELKEGESVMNHMDLSEKKSSIMSSWSEKLTGFIKSSLGGDDTQDDKNENQEETVLITVKDGISINLENYHVTGNDTRSEL